MSKGFARSGWPRGTEVIQSADFVADAVAHTKGAWVEVDASVASDVAGIVISSNLTIGVSGADRSMLFDIGIGGAGSEAVVVANVPVGGYRVRQPVFLPIHIPAGSRIAGRIQATLTLDTFEPNVTLLFGGRPGSWGGYSIAETIGVNTATSAPTTGDLADNAWDEAVASTANAYRALTFHPCIIPNAASTMAAMTLDVGVGGAGSERVLGTFFAFGASTEIVDITTPFPIEAGTPAGSRLAIRKNSTSDMSGALIGWR